MGGWETNEIKDPLELQPVGMGLHITVGPVGAENLRKLLLSQHNP